MLGNRVLFAHNCYYYKNGFYIGIGMYARLVLTAKGQTVQIEPIDRDGKMDSGMSISIPVEDIDRVIELLTFLKGQSDGNKTKPTTSDGNVPEKTEGSS